MRVVLLVSGRCRTETFLACLQHPRVSLYTKSWKASKAVKCKSSRRDNADLKSRTVEVSLVNFPALHIRLPGAATAVLMDFFFLFFFFKGVGGG